ncbi:mandelate racemase/muconate lactonizing enzyme family protein [Pusillimonas sp. ANT_WB101]|nr:mandelate racemase/muconate lactonizing enzyme family protein [Pusillimonas sp. ANT_WB101]
MSLDIRITALKTTLVALPLERTLKTSIHEISSVCCLLVTLETDAGIKGEGYGFCFDPARLAAIAQFTESMASLVINRNPHDVQALWHDFIRSCNFYGQSGVSVLAYNPIDIACWDIIGKAANRPLHQLFGTYRERVPVYASGGLWLSSSKDELCEEAQGFVAQGFKAMKMRLGSPDWRDDIARVEAVRSTIGEGVTLMADANQGLTAAQALKLGRELGRFGLAWFEEPVPTWDDDAAAMLVSKLDTPIASAETEYTSNGIKRMAQNKAASVFMPDLQRMGGYTEMLKAVRYLAALDLPVSPHIFTEHSLHIVASAANATWCEHMPWFARLFNEEMVVESDGMIRVPDRPGAGFTFDWNRIDRYRIPGPKLGA